MNKKAEAFRKYLKKSGIKSFMMDDMHDRRLNTVIFRTFIEAQGTELPLVLVLDDTLYSTIRVLVAPKVLKNGNETAVYNLINEYNRTYKSFKYCVDEEGALILDVCYIGDDVADGEIISVLFSLIIRLGRLKGKESSVRRLFFVAVTENPKE